MAKKSQQDVTFNEEVTEEVLEEGKEKKKRQPSRKSVLRKSIFDAVLLNVDDLPSKIRDMVVEYNSIPSRGRRGGAGAPSVASQLKEMILEKTNIHEDVLYEKFKMGRLECKRKFYNMRTKLAKAEDAIYVSFNPETGMYTLVGQGAEPPAGFDPPRVKQS